MVHEVEELRPELQFCLAPDIKILEQRNIDADDACRRDRVPARISERSVSGRGERRGVNPIQGSLILRHPRNTGHRVRAIFAVRVGHAYVGNNCPRFPGLERGDRLQYPTPDDVVEERIDIAGKSFPMQFQKVEAKSTLEFQPMR